jgi:hypothetical protein
MSVFRTKLWTGVGAAVLLSAGGLSACSGESGGAAGEGGAAAPAASGAAPAGEGGEGGAEGGAAPAEAGATAVYGSVPAESRTALRLAHLEGFVLAADPVRSAEGPEAAAALVGQGLLEVFDPAAAELRAAGLDEAVLRRAAQSGSAGDVAAAKAAIDAAQQRAGGDPRAVARGMSGITAGLYREALAGGTLDPIEYQHAYAAAQSTQALAASSGQLASAKAEIDRLARLFPSATAPSDAGKAPKLAEVQAQASRIELALSGA